MRLARWLLVSAIFFAALPAQIAVAGTTGSLVGHVVTAMSAPVADADVVATAHGGEQARTRTDASGGFTFASVAPDQYTVVAQHPGFKTVTLTGIAVLANQTSSVRIEIGPSEIAVVHSRTAYDLVAPGTVSDVYSITPAIANLTKTVGGSGSFTQSYSALAATPGVNVPQGQLGWYQFAYLRGGAQDQAGWEFDGVPINRSYDNAPQTMLSGLGQQELQVYTGGVPATADAPSITGYINQVAKRGTFPGYATLELSTGFPAFLHEAKFETGGMTPDRRFSYYIGMLGSNQDYRFFDQFNGIGAPGFFYPLNVPTNNGYAYDGSGPALFSPGASYGFANTEDRENVANLHFAIPHKHGDARDDIQLLAMNGDILLHFYSSPFEIGAGALTGGVPLRYPDGLIYSGPVFAPLQRSAVSVYSFPSSPTGRGFDAPIGQNVRDANENGVSLLKLQYQHNVSASEYFRLYAYELYSYWFQNGPVSGALPWGDVVTDYENISHTGGINVSFVKAIGEKHLATLEALFSKGTLSRYSPTGGFPTSSVGAPISNWIDGSGNCYNPATGTVASCYDASVRGKLGFDPATGAPAVLTPPVTAPANSAGMINHAQWIATDSGYSANLDTVAPVFSALAFDDVWRPNDRITADLGLRVENFTYQLADTVAGYPARSFWFAAYNREYCFGSSFPEPVYVGLGTCPSYAPTRVGALPNGGMINTSGGDMSAIEWQPRFAAADALGRDDVLRASYGVYARPPNTAWAQFTTVQQDSASYLGKQFLAYGFNTPRHDERPDRSYNADLSWEHRLRGRNVSFKISPFYRSTADQMQSFNINALTGLRAGLNVGHQVSSGVELLVEGGDPNHDGLAWRLAYTHTRSRIRFSNFANGRNVIDNLNAYILQYNALTKAGGGAPCYSPGTIGPGGFTAGKPVPIAANCSGAVINNPYYNTSAQPLLDRNGWYSPYDVIPGPFAAANGYETPDVATLVFSWKHRALRITPAFTYSSGATYGSPLQWPGYIPSLCTGVIAPATAAGNANANTATCGNVDPTVAPVPFLFQPDPYTGSFDNLAAFRDPSRFTASMSIDYEVSSRVHATLSLTNIVDHCSLRGHPWEYPGICVYAHLPGSLAPAGNFDANPPAQLKYPYAMWLNNTEIGTEGTQMPFQALFTLQVSL